MFTIKVSEEIIVHCLHQIEQYNFGQRCTANGNKDQQLTGIIGQTVLMDLFGFDYINGAAGCDDGIDFIFNSKKIDVKTMGRTTDVRLAYTNNFLKLQDYFQTEIYIFCSYNKIKKEVTVCGWIAKEDFVSRRKFFPKGSIRIRSDGTNFPTFSDLYEIDNIDLNPVTSIEDLKNQLNLL